MATHARSSCSVGLGLLLLTSAAHAANLAGTWELQTMGADREVRIEQQGTKILAHRIMWPEFEGKKYKLEHLYRGELSGTKLDGDLLVKEEELPSFEVLRTFTGSVTSDDRITLDGLPMKRVGPGTGTDAKPAEPVPTTPKNSARPSDAPGLAQASPPPPPSADAGSNLFASIMESPGMDGMFKIALAADLSEEAKALADEADRRFGHEDYVGALDKYGAAQRAAGGRNVEFLHRIGRCHLKLEQFDEAANVLKHALKLDPANAALKKDYKLAVDRSGKPTAKSKARSKVR